MMGIRSTQQGFTLIEVLVALTLMALVSLISWRGLDAVRQTGDRLDERAEDTLSMLRVLGQIERDILLHAGPDVLVGPASKVAGDGEAGARMPPGIAWDPSAGLDLVRAAGEGRWQRLRWHLQDGRLLRAVGTPSHLLPLPAAETSVVVLPQVRALTVKVWQASQGWVAPGLSGAGNSARAGDDAGLIGIEIALYRLGMANDEPYRKVVLLP